MHSESGRFVIIFNGEIYNYRQLGASLENEGWRPRGRSDTEVLLAAVERWGLSTFLDRVDAQFAFALYDTVESRLYLARDRFGEKPLAYCISGTSVYFASELRAFDQVPDLDLTLDPTSTADYFRFGHVPGTATIFRGIRRVAQSTYVEIDLRGGTQIREHTYWRMPSRDRTNHRVGATSDEQLNAVLSESVRDRLVSDRPIGAFLSGGIDSSLVCVLAAEHTSGPLKTFTMGWDNAEYDESRQAGRVAYALGSDHHDVRLSRIDVVDAVDRLGSVMDEPFADSSQLAVLLVSTAARKDVVVALSGDGGDELFAGYNRHKWLLSTRALRARLPGGTRRVLATAATRLAPSVEQLMRPISTSHRPRLVSDKIQKLAKAIAAPSMIDSYQALISADQDVGEPKPLAPELRDALESQDPDVLLWGLRSADIAGYMCDDVLTKVDRATMAVSLESRSPFLHRQLAELAMSLDSRDLIARSGGKQPLRTMLHRLLPDIDFDQPKMGFGVPVADLLRSDLRGKLADAVSMFVKRGPPVDIDWRALSCRLDEGDDSVASMLWAVLMFELWAQQRNRPIVWS
jgi:asparagine synthase (glutamine-hydrolysing)